MLNDVKPPPMQYGQPDPAPGDPPDPATERRPGAGDDGSVVLPHGARVLHADHPCEMPDGVSRVGERPAAIPAHTTNPVHTTNLEHANNPTYATSAARSTNPLHSTHPNAPRLILSHEEPGAAHQPPAHREVLEGHPDLPRREPASANTPGYVNEREHQVGGDAASLNPRVSEAVVRGARKGDTPDGAVYDYPTRGSFNTIALSIIVVVLVLGCIAYLVTRMI